MKRIKFTLSIVLPFFLILGTQSSKAQWTAVYSDNGYHIMGIEFKDANTAFAGGFFTEEDSVGIIRSTDGGNTWQKIFTLPDYYAGPYVFDFINDTLAISGGQDGMLYRSTDGGNSWEFYSDLGGNNDINFIRFFNENTGIASGMRTTDGGYTWEWMDIGKTNDICITNDSTAFAATWSGLYHTSDYGESWMELIPEADDGFKTVCLASEQKGFAVSYSSKIFRSLDGGSSWNLLDSIDVSEVKQMRFVDEYTGYALVNNNNMRVMKSTDGGETWNYVLFSTGYANQMALYGEETILAPTENGYMYKTSSGGGDPILPDLTEVEFASSLQSNSYVLIEDFDIDSSNHLILSGRFKDSLFFNGNLLHLASNEDYWSGMILKLNPWGGFAWTKMLEFSDKDYIIGTLATDAEQKIYLIHNSEQDNESMLEKLDPQGESIWSQSIIYSDSFKELEIHVKGNGHIILTGSFTGMLEYQSQSITTDFTAAFLLETDQEGNLVELKRLFEVYTTINKKSAVINNPGSLAMKVQAPGYLFINSDTLGFSGYHLVTFDEGYNFSWYKDYPEGLYAIESIQFKNNENLLVNGFLPVNDTGKNVILEYNNIGELISSYTLGGTASYEENCLVNTTSSRFLVGGNYQDYSIMDSDTLFDFGNWQNIFLYSFNDNFEIHQSSHFGGTSIIIAIKENNNISYIIGGGWQNVFFQNDTVYLEDEPGYYIARLNSLITPVNESQHKVSISCFPNPVHDILHIVLGDDHQRKRRINVFSLNGQLIMENEYSSGNIELNVSKLKKGVYFIQADTGSKIGVQRIIKL